MFAFGLAARMSLAYSAEAIADRRNVAAAGRALRQLLVALRPSPMREHDTRQVALRPDRSPQGADARFYGDWLRAAAKADAVWKLNGRAPSADERPSGTSKP